MLFTADLKAFSERLGVGAKVEKVEVEDVKGDAEESEVVEEADGVVVVKRENGDEVGEEAKGVETVVVKRGIKREHEGSDGTKVLSIEQEARTIRRTKRNRKA